MSQFSKKRSNYPQRKKKLYESLEDAFINYDQCIVIGINNIPSFEIAKMRKKLKTKIIFGKNSIIKKVIRDYIKKSKNYNLLKLLPLIKGNCGLVFTKLLENEIIKLCDEILNFKCICSAKCGIKSPLNIYIKKGLTNLEPNETGFLQSMNIETRIINGKIAITNNFCLINQNNKINSSQTILLSKLNIKPFIYNVKIFGIYNPKKNIQIENMKNIVEDYTIELKEYKEYESDEDTDVPNGTDVDNGIDWGNGDTSESESEESNTDTEDTDESS